ncbi:IucA/IucC family C-terminal-domain containing protein [Sutcliffiella horikoshii]|uniref:IucA/IucC family C-terminal-domain containing protein n=1 Tax=Sutcliffiella horikoshii TaxID=79883 RepID=UPI001EEEAAB1|nr:IucA/IucC family C-terminal-domain containing protein [Sutcliffiella horikoshii]MCG1021703.1 iron reductase [Sutcliffiella horikoshii]
MMGTLTKQEFRFLEESCRFVAGEAEVEDTISLHSLIHDGTEAYLLKVQEALGTDEMDVAASLLMKRLGFLAVNCLLSMSAFNKTLKVDPSTIWIDSYVENDVWLPKLRYTKVQAVEVTAYNTREEWRVQHFKELFHDLFAPLIQRLSKVAKVSRQTLWENIVLYIYWMYESILPNIELDTPYQEEDFKSLLEADPALFGMKRNPAATFYKPKTFVEQHQAEMRMRTTCCYYYKTNSEGARCSTCPLNCNV